MAYDLFVEYSDHCRKVATLTLLFAEALHFPEEYCRRLRSAALLHDVGKLNISHEILSMPGPLDSASRSVVERHTLIGWQMAREWQVLNGERRMTLEVILSHHERYDGDGYPRGLKGRRIPFPARVVAIADVVQALSVDRCYRPAWEWERIMEYVDWERGRQFDPDLADLFLSHNMPFRDALTLSDSGRAPGRKISGGLLEPSRFSA